MGLLQPLTKVPDLWNIATVCRLLANQQFSQLNNEQAALPGNGGTSGALPQVDPKGLLLELLDAPHEWQVRPLSLRGMPLQLKIFYKGQQRYTLRPQLTQPEPRLRQRISHWHNLNT